MIITLKQFLRSSKLRKETNFLLTSVFALLSLYITFVAIFDRSFFKPLSQVISSNSSAINGASSSSPPPSSLLLDDGTDQLILSFFSVFFLWICALFFGRLLQYAHLPPLFGMLLVGIAFANLPFLRNSIQILPSWDNFLRKTAFVLILVRCAIGLNPKTLRESIIFCTASGIVSTSFEIVAIILVAHFLFNVSLSSSILFGFVLASTSPAVTVPTMIQFQQRKMGTQKGIPTMVLASASIDNIFAISGFTIAFAIVSAPLDQISSTLIWVSIQLLMALLLGSLTGNQISLIPGFHSGIPFLGALLIWLPDPNASAVHFSRSLLLCFTSMALYFGTKAATIEIAGPIAVIIASFIAAVRWKNDNPKETNVEAETLRLIWNLLLLPLLFVLIGLLFDLSIFTFTLLANALLTILIGVIVRFIVVFLITLFNRHLKWPERLFFTSVFLPKATVQAALAPALFHFASSSSSPSSSQFMLQSCILSILLTAPFGQLLIQLLGNKLLTKQNRNSVVEMECHQRNTEAEIEQGKGRGKEDREQKDHC